MESKNMSVLERFDLAVNKLNPQPDTSISALDRFDNAIISKTRFGVGISEDDIETSKNYIDPELSKNRTLGQAAKDMSLSLAQGFVGTGQAFVGLADLITPGDLGGYIEDNLVDFNESSDFYQKKKSDYQKAGERESEEAKGIWDNIKAAATNPTTVMPNLVLQSLPTMFAGAKGAKFLTSFAKLAETSIFSGALGEGLMTAGGIQEGIRSEQGHETSVKQKTLSSIAGITTGSLGLLGGKVASKLGIADVDTALAGGNVIEAAKRKGITKSTIYGAISEGILEELPQNIQETVLQNLATDKDAFEGLDKAAVLGTLSGMAMGGPMAGVSALKNNVGVAAVKESQKTKPVKPKTPVEKVVNARQQAESEVVSSGDPLVDQTNIAKRETEILQQEVETQMKYPEGWTATFNSMEQAIDEYDDMPQSVRDSVLLDEHKDGTVTLSLPKTTSKVVPAHSPVQTEPNPATTIPEEETSTEQPSTTPVSDNETDHIFKATSLNQLTEEELNFLKRKYSTSSALTTASLHPESNGKDAIISEIPIISRLIEKEIAKGTKPRDILNAIVSMHFEYQLYSGAWGAKPLLNYITDRSEGKVGLTFEDIATPTYINENKSSKTEDNLESTFVEKTPIDDRIGKRATYKLPIKNDKGEIVKYEETSGVIQEQVSKDGTRRMLYIKPDDQQYRQINIELNGEDLTEDGILTIGEDATSPIEEVKTNTSKKNKPETTEEEVSVYAEKTDDLIFQKNNKPYKSEKTALNALNLRKDLATQDHEVVQIAENEFAIKPLQQTKVAENKAQEAVTEGFPAPSLAQTDAETTTTIPEKKEALKTANTEKLHSIDPNSATPASESFITSIKGKSLEDNKKKRLYLINELSRKSGLVKKKAEGQILALDDEINRKENPAFDEGDIAYQLKKDTNKKRDSQLEAYLVKMLSKYNVTVKQLSSLKEKFGVDATGVADLLNKTIHVKADRDLSTLPEEAVHMALALIGAPSETKEYKPTAEQNALSRLLKEIKRWDGYAAVEEEYRDVYKGNEEKIKFEAVGKLVTEALLRKHQKNKNMTTLHGRAFELIKAIVAKIKELFGNTPITPFTKRSEQLANKILSGDLGIDTDISEISPVDYKEAVNANPLATSLINRVESLGGLITGSLGIAKTGEKIYRPDSIIHDLDFVINQDIFNKLKKFLTDPKIKVILFIPDNGKKYYTISFAIPAEGYTIKTLPLTNKELIRKEFFAALNPDQKPSAYRKFEVLDKNGNVVENKDSTKAMHVDFFVMPEDFDISSVDPNYIYRAKAKMVKEDLSTMRRPKDLKDLALRVPLDRNKVDKDFLHFQLEDKQGSVPIPNEDERSLSSLENDLVRLVAEGKAQIRGNVFLVEDRDFIKSAGVAHSRGTSPISIINLPKMREQFKNKILSKQQLAVMNKMGINEKQFYSLFDTEKEFLDFIVAHEQSHITNNDTSVYNTVGSEFKGDKKYLFDDRVLEVEKRANIDALNEKQTKRYETIRNKVESAKPTVEPLSKVPAAEKIKAPFKASKATKYIGFGKEGSSTELYGQQLEGSIPVNSEEYNDKDIVFVSINGSPSRADFNDTLALASQALESGAMILTDSEEYISKSKYNKGERDLAKALLEAGYTRQTTKGNKDTAIWKKKNLSTDKKQSEEKPKGNNEETVKQNETNVGKEGWAKTPEEIARRDASLAELRKINKQTTEAIESFNPEDALGDLIPDEEQVYEDMNDYGSWDLADDTVPDESINVPVVSDGKKHVVTFSAAEIRDRIVNDLQTLAKVLDCIG